jgi:inorganic pyrophosphatase
MIDNDEEDDRIIVAANNEIVANYVNDISELQLHIVVELNKTKSFQFQLALEHKLYLSVVLLHYK